MWQRFTEDVRRMVWQAQAEAQTLGHRTVSAHHFLLALLREGNPAVSLILTRCGIQPEQVLAILTSLSPSSVPRWEGEISLAREGKHAIDGAYEEARLLRSSAIGPEHILLGLFYVREGLIDKFVRRERRGNLAAEVLIDLGLNLEAARCAVRELELGVIPKSNYPRPDRA